MTYVLQIVGVVLLSVLADVLLPNGQINKFVKGVFSIVLTFTVLTPLNALVNGQTDVFQRASDALSVSVDENYLSQIERNKNEYYSNIIARALAEEGVEAEVTVDSGMVTVILRSTCDHSTVKDVIRSHINVADENIVIVYG
ncbi:MAG: stage III sporulation protein AF [Clostridia bacterium]|nr:stage III sporulation protein AF [Clostridia bacterium]